MLRYFCKNRFQKFQHLLTNLKEFKLNFFELRTGTNVMIYFTKKYVMWAIFWYNQNIARFLILAPFQELDLFFF